jgi:hypothetical protein
MMNQALRRPLRPWHLLLFFALWMASAPAVAQALPAAQNLAASSFRFQFPAPAIAGRWAPFTITALDSGGQPIEAFIGVVTVTASGAGAEVNPSVYTYLLLDKGVGQFQALWPRSGPQQLTVSEALGTTQQETVPVLAGPAIRLELQVPAQPVQAGATVRVRVVAFDVNNNVATDFIGPIRFSSSDTRATLPQNATFEVGDYGEKAFDVVFRTANSQPQKLAVSDGRALLPTDTKDIAVMPGPATALQLLAPAETLAGQGFTLQVRAMDAFGNVFPYMGPLQFSSSDPLAFLPPGTTTDPGPFTVALKTAPAQSITATGMNSITGQVSLEVLPTSFYAVVLATPVTQPVDACSPAEVRIRAADRYGNTVPEAKEVILCGTPSPSLEYTGHTLSNARSEEAGCITGMLPATGEGQVTWSNKEPGSVTFTATPSVGGTVTINWREAGFSPKDSILSFPDAPGTPPSVRTFTGELKVRMELRNACGERVDLPASQVLTFKAESPLALTSPGAREELGLWSTSVRLPRCPDTASVPLKIAPLINDEPIILPSGATLLTQVLPNCLPPAVQLALQTRPREAKAVPGARVEFEVTVSNTGDRIIPEGQLWLETQALTGRQASFGDAPFADFDTKLSLPQLAPGATHTVKLQGQAAVQMDPPVSLTAWYTTPQGAALTEQKSLSLEWGKLEVDVGNGCQTAPLPSQFLPWLALLAAASRSRSRLRRLTRGERNDR